MSEGMLSRFLSSCVEKLFPDPFSIERSLREVGFRYAIGVDEAGTGAFFGPVHAAAVVFDLEALDGLPPLKDSKKLTEQRREEVYDEIVRLLPQYEIATVSVTEINVFENVQQAGGLARWRAVNGVIPFCKHPTVVLVDHFSLQNCPFPTLAITRGDELVQCIAYASILAKVSRDRLMRSLAREFPEFARYGIESNKGYRCRAHWDAIRKYGLSPLHRKYMPDLRRLVDA